MQDLFSPFGPISRIYIAYDRDTGEARGFAFVNFVYSQDAQRAIEKLDGCALVPATHSCMCVVPWVACLEHYRGLGRAW